MSIHTSLKLRAGKSDSRSVLKRAERIKVLMAKGQWSKDSSVYGLPKIKVVKIKVKKEKAQEKPAETATPETKAESVSSPSKT